jgi:hypothetical protein
MSLLTWAALAVGILAMLGLAIGLADSWFFALLAMACLLGSADAAYRELRLWAIAFLALGAVFTTASGRAIYITSRERRRQ